MSQVLVLLGASGRLGRVVRPLAVAAGFEVVLVSRTAPAVPASTASRHLVADLTLVADRARVAALAATMSSPPQRICVMDVVLDRSGVAAMRRSVKGVTETVLHLRDELRADGRDVALVSASTTAVLAPGLYQTPYGLAKRCQVVRYARSGLTGSALLLPQLAQQPGTEVALRPVWSFAQAARVLVAAAVAQPDDFTVRVPAIDTGAGAAPVAASDNTLLAHLHSLVLDRDSMHAHRAAAGSRLGLLPEPLRLRVDHHAAPTRLVHRFGRRYHLAVIDERTTVVPARRRAHG
ncbi:hypothetical protein ACN28G_02990 [Micromonospora sp. WMMA1923]|uniref:hypothetical protein n=1 Tax=Micromonospora sp. WMMA1923 TaxID=3404125 RepID=UPI003B9571C7